MIRPLEALADAVSSVMGYNNPEGPSYQNRNPLGLKAYSDKHAKDSTGQRIFGSLLDGYQAGLFDLAVKCVGRSRTHLKPTSTIEDLMKVYGWPLAVGKVVSFLQRALQDETISKNTHLSHFVESV